MKIALVIALTLVIWLSLLFALCVIISFVRYAWQEIRHEIKNAKKFFKEMLIDLEWACKHRKKGNVNYEYDYE